MIVVTGGAGFIGSNLIRALNEKGIFHIIVVDNITAEKKRNMQGLKYDECISKEEFLSMVKENNLKDIEMIFHLGACTDTTVTDKEYLLKNNTEYSKALYEYCAKFDCRFIYASSGATYGDGSRGYSDKNFDLEPLNYYGLSKHVFDVWALERTQRPQQWVGLKFFNVYGPNEYHKGEMASVIYKGYKQIINTGGMRLFKSNTHEYKDGEQKRDFIYIKDVIKVILFFLHNPDKNGIFNVGTGRAQFFLDLGNAIFKSLGKIEDITFIDMPHELNDKYQNFTQAEIQSLRDVGYKEDFVDLQHGVDDYVKNYLEKIYN